MSQDGGSFQNAVPLVQLLPASFPLWDFILLFIRGDEAQRSVFCNFFLLDGAINPHTREE